MVIVRNSEYTLDAVVELESDYNHVIKILLALHKSLNIKVDDQTSRYSIMLVCTICKHFVCIRAVSIPGVVCTICKHFECIRAVSVPYAIFCRNDSKHPSCNGMISALSVYQLNTLEGQWFHMKLVM